jgi:hypothetical protein
VKKDDDMRAVEEEAQGRDSFVLKKMQQSAFRLEEMDRIFKGTTRKWTDPDFNYEKLVVRGF